MDKEMLIQLAIAAIAAPLASVALLALGKLLMKLPSIIDAKVGGSLLKAGLLKLNHLAAAVVADLNANLVPEIKALSVDGKITKEEGQKLLKFAVERIKIAGGKELKQFSDDVIGGVVEQHVAAAKLPLD